MKKWVDQIRLQSDHYGSQYWRYHHSGTVMELIVDTPYRKNQSEYRKAIIHVGMVLQALSDMAAKSGQTVLIQSFPSLDDLQVVAAVRIQRGHSSTNNSGASAGSKHSSRSMFSQICAFADKYQLHFEEISRSEIPENTEIDPDESFKWYALPSRFDNPFTWLRIGQWKEVVNKLMGRMDNEKMPQIITDRPALKELKSTSSRIRKNYIQGFVIVNTESV